MIVVLLLSCLSVGDPAAAPPADSPAPARSVDPHWACQDPFVTELAAGNRHWATSSLQMGRATTGVPLFDEEWRFGTWAMAAVGLGQHARLCPSTAAEDVAAMESALQHMLSPAGLAFDRGQYGGRPITERLAEDHGSIAALGYGGLALALHRAVAPPGDLTTVEAAWMDAIARRLGPHLAETYPRERYPVDNAAAVGALGLHDRVTGADHSAPIAATLRALHAAVDPHLGLLHQRVGADGTPQAPGRGSGTFLAAWFLHRTDRAFATALYEAGREQLGSSMLGMAAMREYPRGVDGVEDVDSGPLLNGLSMSATGFALGGATALGDRVTREALVETARWGAPVALEMVPGLETHEHGGATGSALGDAILLAMLTSEGLP